MSSLTKIIDKLFSGGKGTYQYENINDPMTMSMDELLFELDWAKKKEQREKEKEKERDEFVEK